MAAPDLDVIKDIPGYKVILKAVLKSQIQQLVEQLASTTEEESVILTASVADGTLSHLGSQSGKGFLEDHEDIKSQFLGFCLKKHHRDKQEKERQEAEAALIQATQAAARQRSPRGPYPARSPRFSSPHGPGPIHPVALTRSPRGGGMISPGNRHEPYPAARPSRRTSTEPSPVKVNNGSGQVIKVELDTHSNENDTINQDTDQSSSHQSNAPSSVKSESGEKDEDAQSESSNSTIPNEPLAEGISLDSDLSNVISGPSHTQSGESSEIDPNVSVKIEALTESEMELEITGVEPGRPVVPQDNWDPNISLGMNFDPSQGATGNQADMSGQGYKNRVYPLHLIVKDFSKLGENDAQLKRAINVIKTITSSSEQETVKGEIEENMVMDNSKIQECFMEGGKENNEDCKDVVQDKIGKNVLLNRSVKEEPGMDELNNVVQSRRTYESEVTENSLKELAKYLPNTENEIKKKHACKICGKRFEKKSKIERHLVVHTGEKKYFCELCGKGFGFRESLKEHLKRMHKDGKVEFPLQKEKKCGICFKSFTLPVRLREHMVTHTGAKPFICKICSKCFAYRTCLIRHHHQNHSKKKFCCEICGKMFGIMPYLEEHRRCVHKVVEDQNKTSGNVKGLLLKKNRNDISNIMGAAFIGTDKETKSAEEELGVNTEAAANAETFELLELEGTSAKVEDSEGKHLDDFNEDTEGDISILSTVDSTAISFDEADTKYKPADVIGMSAVLLESKNHCRICGKKFPSSWKLKRHMITHSSEREFPCDVCEKAYKNESTLHRHRETIHNLGKDEVWPFAADT
ncbi:zinc finger protein 492-like isoform X1 [Mercenaria mercenaria]|uniref:zinc finger protein 492-like isoform X1 n=1 Tax=Mercenaria mercenaria TaxID=6596 RepID=UPI00234ED192|nr:zinc finger protein 492-like isoform X1 [Mercenaria mercenaria]